MAAAGVRGVQFIVNSESQQVRNLDFADDVILLVEFEEDLQLALDTIQSFYIKRKLTPNPKKCELIVFDPKTKSEEKADVCWKGIERSQRFCLSWCLFFGRRKMDQAHQKAH